VIKRYYIKLKGNSNGTTFRVDLTIVITPPTDEIAQSAS